MASWALAALYKSEGILIPSPLGTASGYASGSSSRLLPPDVWQALTTQSHLYLSLEPEVCVFGQPDLHRVDTATPSMPFLQTIKIKFRYILYRIHK